jgi:hypothetical protein
LREGKLARQKRRDASKGQHGRAIRKAGGENLHTMATLGPKNGRTFGSYTLPMLVANLVLRESSQYSERENQIRHQHLAWVCSVSEQVLTYQKPA